MGALPRHAAELRRSFSVATFISSLATPALAETSAINPADTAWMIAATALVLMMTIPGLALFYSGMVRKKNVLATMAQSLAAVALISILWVAFGYSLAFVGDGPWLGTLDRWFLAGMKMDDVNPAAKTIPEALVHAVPDDVCDHHRGAGGGRGGRPDAVLGLSVVLGRLVHVRLRSAGALGLGRRLSRHHGRAGFCRRPRRASQRRGRRAGGGQGDGPASWLRHRESGAVRSVAGGDRHRHAVGRMVRLQRRLGACRPARAR